MALLVLKSILRNLLILLILFLGFTSTSALAITQAGTKISNQANMTYFDEDQGKFVEVLSNVSLIKVKVVLGVTLSPVSDDGIQPSIIKKTTPGMVVSMPQTIKNIGNVTDQYNVQVINLSGDSGDVYTPGTNEIIKVYIDLNGDGLVDPGEPELFIDDEKYITPALKPNENLDIIYYIGIESNAQGNDFFNLKTNVVSSQSSEVKASEIAEVQVVLGPIVELSINGSKTCDDLLAPGDTLSYRVNYTSIGTSAPEESDYSYEFKMLNNNPNNGLYETVSHPGILITTNVPGNINISKDKLLDNDQAPQIISSPLNDFDGGIVLIGINELGILSPTNTELTWYEYASWNGQGAVERMGFLVRKAYLNPNRSGYFTYYSSVDDYYSAVEFSIYTTAQATLDESENVITKSNPFCNTLSPTVFDGNKLIDFVTLDPNLAIPGSSFIVNHSNDEHFLLTDYYYHADAPDFEPSLDGIFVNVVLPQANKNSGVPDIIGYPESDYPVLLKSESGDQINWILMETGPNTGVFRNITTVQGVSNIDRMNDTCGPNPTEEWRTGLENAVERVSTFINLTTPFESCQIIASFNDLLSVNVYDNNRGASLLLEDFAYVSPQIEVFDSTSFKGIEGAKVEFFQTNGGSVDVNAEPISVTISNADGFAAYPKLRPTELEQYYIIVTPPDTHIWPSQYKNLDHFNRHLVKPISYGLNGNKDENNSGLFSLSEFNAVNRFDVPVDPVNLDYQLTIQKDGDKKEIEIGSFIKYTLTVRNNISNSTLYNAQVFDSLPYGFKYIKGSTRLNDQAYKDPVRIDGYTVRFDIGTLNAANEPPLNGIYTISYVLQATAGAIDSDGINSAYVTAATLGGSSADRLISNVAKYQVGINQSGVLSDRGIIFGKVYVDANCDMIQDNREWPIGGVKIYLENGDFAITDENGQYSFFGVESGIRSLQVDKYTLPKGIKLKPLDTRNAGSGISRFIDISRGEMHKANFASECISENRDEIYAELISRNTSIDSSWQANNIDNFKGLQSGGSVNLSTDDLITGTISGPNQINSFNEIKINPTVDSTLSGYALEMARGSLINMQEALDKLPKNINEKGYIYEVSPDLFSVRFGFSQKDNTDLVKMRDILTDYGIVTNVVSSLYQKIPKDGHFRLNNQIRARIPKPEELVNDLTKDEGKNGSWYWPKDNYSYDGRFIAVVRGDVDPVLMINGEEVSDNKLGERLINKSSNAQILGWYGTVLRPGDNLVQVMTKDAFGNHRVLLERTFVSPEKVARIEITSDKSTFRADNGHSVIPINIRLYDKNNNLARGIYFVTLTTDQGDIWLNPDIQNNEPGHQIRIINGEQTAYLRSTNVTGPLQITAEVNSFGDNLDLYQVADNRPLFVNGIISYTGRYANISGDFTPNKVDDYKHHKYEDVSRLATFMKGQIKGGMHLTLSYDSDKKHEELFREQAPDSYYPLPGDASIKGYDARSKSKVFAKLERDRNFIMWGDYSSSDGANVFDLGRTNQVLNGFNSVYDNGEFRAQAYISRPSDLQRVVEFPGNGTAMMYDIGFSNIIPHSDTVTIEIYDRNSPSLVLSEQTLIRYVDYTIDYFTGNIQFNRVIPTYDDELNPIYVQVSFDIDGNGNKYTVAGGRVSYLWNDDYTFNNDLIFGLSYQHNAHDDDGYNIGSLWFEYEFDEQTQVMASIATMNHKGQESASGIVSTNNNKLQSGQAIKLKVDRNWQEDVTTQLEYARADEGFTNSTGGITAGRQDIRLHHRQKVYGKTGVNIEGTDSRSLSSSEKQQTIGLTIDTVLPGTGLRTRLGSRYINNNNTGMDNEEFVTGIIGIGRSFTMFDRMGRIDSEYEHSIHDSEYRFNTKIDWQAHEQASIYGQYERIDSLGGISNLGSGQTGLFTAGVNVDWLNGSSSYNEFRQRGASDGRSLELANGFRGRYEPIPGISIDPSVEYIEVLKGEGTDGVSTSVGLADVRNANFKSTGRIEFRHSNEQDYYGVNGALVTRLNLDWSALFRDEFRYTRIDNKENSWINHLTFGTAYRPRLFNQYNMLLAYEWKEEHQASSRSAHIFSTHQNYQISPLWNWSGRLGMKWENYDEYDQDYSSVTSIFDTRMIYNIDRRWDIDVRGGILGTDGLSSRRYSIGMGVNYLLLKNLRMGLGYNFFGFKDKDLDPQGYNLNGVYFNVMFKFDETVFDWLAE